MYKLITSARNFDDLSFRFARSRHRRKQELTNIENIKRKYHVRIYLKDNFGFAEHQEKAIYGLGHRLLLTRNADHAVLNKHNAVNNVEIEIFIFEWYVPHYTPTIPQQATFLKQRTNNLPTELQYVERSDSRKEVKTQKFRTFELGTQEGVNVPKWIVVGFQQQDRQNSQN